MYQIRARNVNEAYVLAAQLLNECNILEETRNGLAYVAKEPVTTHYENPWERVLFNAKRDANPFFHLFESFWILAGRADTKWLARFNKQIVNYSDDGNNFYGAYGWRLRQQFDFDQLKAAIYMLKEDPSSRRVYLPIYYADLGANSKDIPCNVGIKFEIRDGELNMCVFNRSNDIVWGTYGANVVQFSMIQEYLAMHLGVKIGWYEQISTNFHAYKETFYKHDLDKVAFGGIVDPYSNGEIKSMPFLAEGERPEQWEMDLVEFMKDAQGIHPVAEYKTEYFRSTVSTMLDAWEAYEEKHQEGALHAAHNIGAPDWRLACQQWLGRRKWSSPVLS